MAIDTLPRFYELMRSTVPVRRDAVVAILERRPAAAVAADRLREALRALEAIPEERAGRRLSLETGRPIHLDLGYEIGELLRDVEYLTQGEERLLSELAADHAGFEAEVDAVVGALAGARFRSFVTDRDGTVNNYCGRYASSVQSAYNAVFLTRFARTLVGRAVILTSAPLDDVGLADLAVAPPGAFVHAGSKGREYLDPKGRRRRFPIEARQQEKLDELNRRLAALLGSPGREVFAQIGSGFQRKFGQTTVARQDIAGSIPAERSEGFLAEVRELVRSIDPELEDFRIEDTGLDVEIVLTVGDAGADAGSVRDFDKGDGVRFLNEDLGLGLDQGPCLVCGDTGSDVPMLQAALDVAPEVRTVFVTRREELRSRVAGLLPDALFVSEPDILVAALNALVRGSDGDRWGGR